jgi:outer membrane protein assembly factor BamB
VAVDQGFMAAAAVQDGKVFVGDAAGVFHCFDAQEGREIWKVSTAGKINSSPNLFADSVLFGSQDGSLYRLNCADGKVIWKYTIKADGGIQSSPSLADGHVLFAGCDGSLHVVQAESGRHVGSLDLRDPTLSTAAVVKDQAYFGTEGGNFLAVNWRQPKLLWTYRNPRSDLAYRSSAAATPERIIIGGRNKAIECLSPADGKRLWSYMTGGGIDCSPVIAGDRVYVGSADGRIYGLSLESGKVLWKFDAGGGFSASPAVAQQRLVIGNENGTLYCFGIK